MEDKTMNTTILFTICVLAVAAFGLYLANKEKRP
jgi:hypothetical protein